MCPLAVALLRRRRRKISVESSPGNVLSWLLLHALKMDGTGWEPNVWWWYIASMGLELVGITLLMMCSVVCWISVFAVWTCCGLLLDGVTLAVLVSFIIHKPVLVHLLPLSTTLTKCFTWQSILVNVTTYPALHIFTTYIRECDANPGMMWPSLALVWSCGRVSVHVWVEDTHTPSGSLTLSGLVAGVILVICAVVTRKWLVAPEYSIY